MSCTPDNFIDSALALPESQRENIALQLLQRFKFPGEEIADADFGQELQQRVENYRATNISSHMLDESREIIVKRLAENGAK